MKRSTRLYAALVIAFLAEKSVCFLQRPSAYHRSRTPLPSSSSFSSSASKLHASSSPSPLESQELLSQRQDVAKEALMKLLARQQKEVKETEELIRNLQIDIDMANNNNNNNKDRTISSNSTVASSILAGFDYGFVSRSEGCRFENLDDFNSQLFEGYAPPANIFSLGSQQFMRNLNAMKGEYKDEDEIELTSKQKYMRKQLKSLTLNSTAIWERERSRGPLVAPLVIKIPYLVLCYLLDVVFEDRYVPARFYLLETVARMPYFSYIAMLQLYETLGFWRRSKDVKRVHFAEEWNEFHHLVIMESLGGDQPWWVRFMAQHSAIAYYIGLSMLFAISPSLSYKFSELLETHAVDTYGQFVDENEERLKKMPPSLAAVDYYTVGVSDPMFGEYQTSAIAAGTDIRKSGTNMTSLYDVFVAIRFDEGDHVGTMKACLDPTVPVISPSLETRFLTGVALSSAVGYLLSSGDFADFFADVELIESIDEALPGSQSWIQNLAGGFVGLLQDPRVLEVAEGEEAENVVTGAASLFEALDFDVLATAVLNVLKAIGLLGL